MVALMKEWPTRVRTGRAAQLGDDLGDGPAGDQVVDHGAAGLLGELARGDQGGQGRGGRPPGRARRPGSSGRRRRRRPARCRRARRRTRCWRSTRLPGSIGLASWFGKVPSSSKYIGTRSTWSAASRPKTAGAVWPAMPLPASTTTFSRRPVDRGQRQQVGGVRLEHVLLGDRPGRPRPCGVAPDATRSRISASPVSSPTGTAPARQSLMPLYCAGLWLAVNIAPGMAEVAGGEVELVGGGQPDQRSRRRRPRPRRRRTRRPGPASSAACRGRRRRSRPGHLDERGAGAPGQVVVDLVGDGAAHVVRLEDGVEVAGSRSGGHGRSLTVAGRSVGGRTRRCPRRVPSRPARRTAASATWAAPAGRPRARRRRARAGRRWTGRAASGRARAAAPPSRAARRAARCARRTGRRSAARRRSRAGRARLSGRRRRRSAW